MPRHTQSCSADDDDDDDDDDTHGTVLSMAMDVNWDKLYKSAYYIRHKGHKMLYCGTIQTNAAGVATPLPPFTHSLT